MANRRRTVAEIRKDLALWETRLDDLQKAGEHERTFGPTGYYRGVERKVNRLRDELDGAEASHRDLERWDKMGNKEAAEEIVARIPRLGR